MNDGPLSILGGRTQVCDASWGAEGVPRTLSYLVDYILSGKGEAIVAGKQRLFQKGDCYLVRGHDLESYHCTPPMGLAWIHFAPNDLWMAYLLRLAPPFQYINPEVAAQWQNTFEDLNRAISLRNDSVYVPGPSPCAGWRVQGMLLDLLSHLLSPVEANLPGASKEAYLRLLPAIVHMDETFTQNPPLTEVADKVHLAPEHFLRRFKSTFGITPHAYITQRRMNRAEAMLRGTDFSVGAVAAAVGYEDPFYFSKVFKRHTGLSPRAARQADRLD